MSSAPQVPKILLSIGSQGVISSFNHEFIYNDDDDVIGVEVECDDGTFHKFTNDFGQQTFAEFYGINVDFDLSYDEMKSLIQKQLGWDNDEIRWLLLDRKGATDPKCETTEAVRAWLNRAIEYGDPEFEQMLDEIPDEYTPGLSLFNELAPADRTALGMKWAEVGGPASSVPCIVTSATKEQLNEVLLARGLAYKFV